MVVIYLKFMLLIHYRYTVFDIFDLLVNGEIWENEMKETDYIVKCLCAINKKMLNIKIENGLTMS